MPKLKRDLFAQLCGRSYAVINVAVARGNIVPSGKFIDTDESLNILQLQKWGVDTSVFEGIPKQEPVKKPKAPVRKKTKPAKKKPAAVVRNKPVVIKKDPVVIKKPVTVIKPTKTATKKTETVKSKPKPPANRKPTRERKVYDLNAEPDYSKLMNKTGLTAEELRAELREKTKLDTDKTRIEIRLKEQTAINKELANAKLRGESIPTVMVTGVISSLATGFQNSYKSGSDALILEISHKYKLPTSAVSELKLKLIKLINNSHDKGVEIAKKNLRTIISNVKAIEVERTIIEE